MIDIQVFTFGPFQQNMTLLWDETKETILNTTWKRREESIESKIQQDIMKLKHGKENIIKDKGRPPKSIKR